MTIQTPSQLGENVRRAMYDSRVSQRQLAEKTGLSQPGIYRRLAGEVEFSVSDLMKVSQALGLPMERLLEGVELDVETITVHERPALERLAG